MGVEQRAGVDHERVDLLWCKARKGRINGAIGAGGYESFNLQPICRSQCLQIRDNGYGGRGCGFDEHCKVRCFRYEITQQIEPFGHSLSVEFGQTGYVATRPVEAGDKTK